MSDFVLKYADTRGEVHNQIAQGTSAQEIRERYTRQGFLVYSVKPKSAGLSLSGEIAIPGRRKKLNLEKFLIFNQQFVTLVRAGLPILKSLDLLAERLTDPKLTPYINAVREDVRKGVAAFRSLPAAGHFPEDLRHVGHGRRKIGQPGGGAGALHRLPEAGAGGAQKSSGFADVPVVLIVLVILLMVFLVTYVVPSFATLYSSMSAQLPTITLYLIAIGTTARNYVLLCAGGLAVDRRCFSGGRARKRRRRRSTA